MLDAMSFLGEVAGQVEAGSISSEISAYCRLMAGLYFETDLADIRDGIMRVESMPRLISERLISHFQASSAKVGLPPRIARARDLQCRILLLPWHLIDEERSTPMSSRMDARALGEDTLRSLSEGSEPIWM